MSDLNEIAGLVEIGEATNCDVDIALRYGKPEFQSWVYNNFPTWRRKGDHTVEIVHTNGSGGLWWKPLNILGSLDAAQALFDAECLGWVVTHAYWDEKRAIFNLTNKTTSPHIYARGEAPKPSMAFVSAILRAKAMEDE